MYKENEILIQKPLLILQNKCDSATFSTEDLASLEFTNQTSGKKVSSLQISALEGTGVASVLDWITVTLTSKQFA
jgi:predicted GTPase